MRSGNTYSSYYNNGRLKSRTTPDNGTTNHAYDGTGREIVDMPNKPHVWLVTFAHGAQFLAGQKGLVRSALEVGRIDRAVSWTREELVKTEFYRANKALLDRRRGAGYWAWKPFIILDQLQRAADGDFVVYHDAGPRTLYRFRRSVRPLLQWCGDRRSGMLPGIYYRGANKRWTKRDCFVYMGCDQPRYWQHRQVQSGFCVWQRHARSLPPLLAGWPRNSSGEAVASEGDGFGDVSVLRGHERGERRGHP